MKAIVFLTLTLILTLGSSVAFAFGICGADCQFARLLNIDNDSSSRAYTRIMTSADLRAGREYSSYVDLKTCKAREIQKEENEEGNELVIRAYEGDGLQAFKYFSSWENMKKLNLTPEQYKSLKDEFPKKRKFCFGSYSTADAWTSEYSNFVYSTDDDFFFAEIHGTGI